MNAAAIVEAAGWTLLHFLWQGALIAAVFALFLGISGARAQVRYLAGCFALLAMLVVAAGSFARHYDRAAVESPEEEVAEAPGDLQEPIQEVSFYTELRFHRCRAIHEVRAEGDDGGILQPGLGPCSTASLPGNDVVVPGDAQPDEKATESTADEESASAWQFWLSILWLVGVACFSLRLAFAWFHAERLKVRQVQELPLLAETLARVARRVGVTRPVRLVRSAAVSVPTVVGWLRPVILLPAATLLGLSRGQLEAVLAHELAHIRRHDYLVNLLQHAVEILLFFHPAVWWVSRKIREEREHCCDDVAVTAVGGALDYARALAALEEQRSECVSVVVAADGGSLISRIRRITGVEGGRRLPLLVVPLLVLGAAMAVGIAALRPDPSPENPAGVPGKSDKAVRVAKVQPLPSDQAAKGLRHYLGKEPESGILFDDFERLAKALDQDELLALLDEIGLEGGRGYEAWTRSALVAEWARRDHDGALDYFKARVDFRSGSGSEEPILYAIFRGSRPEDPEEAIKYLRGLEDSPRYQMTGWRGFSLARPWAKWVKHAHERLFAEFAAADPDRAWSYLPGREEEGPLNHSELLDTFGHHYVPMVQGFFSALPDAAAVQKYVERFGPVGEPGTEHVALPIATAWMAHDFEAAYAWAPPQMTKHGLSQLGGGVRGWAIDRWAHEHPRQALQMIEDGSLPDQRIIMVASRLVQGDPHLAGALMDSLSTRPDFQGKPAGWFVLRSAIRDRDGVDGVMGVDRFPEPGMASRPPDFEARYNSLAAAIEHKSFSPEQRSELQALLGRKFRRVLAELAVSEPSSN